MSEIDVEVLVPERLMPLLSPKRYKAAHGGRGGAKSHFFAEQLVIRCAMAPTRAVCIREVQNTLKESSRQLVIDKITKLGFGFLFDIKEAEIRGLNGSLIIFKGMQSYNAENIKSLEDFDIAWVEEAQTMSAKSWRVLRPTLRKEGSEIWASWNPRYETDAVDAFFRGDVARDDATVVEVSWRDNPFLPSVLAREIVSDYASDPEMADHVWGGGYEIISEGAYYARAIAQAENEGRIGDWPALDLPVLTSWDIGVDDYTAIWFFQFDGERVRVIDYFEFSGVGPQDIVPTALPELNPDQAAGAAQKAEIGRDRSYTYGVHFLPHDVRNREWGAGGRTRSLILKELGVWPIHVGANKGAEAEPERVAATRKLLPLCVFNRTKRVMLGVSRLRRYARKFNDQLGTYVKALHDINSHGADAFGEFAVNAALNAPPPPPEKKVPQMPGTVVLPGPPEPATGSRINL